jgi:signal transduction histidine kinase
VNAAIEDTLFSVLKAKRELLVSCWGAKIKAGLAAPKTITDVELIDRIPEFADEIIAALYPDAVPLPGTSENAEEHGAQRLRLHFDVGEVVREYGLLHECILDIARDAGVDVGLREQRVIARWLNEGIADALAQYVKQRDEDQERERSEHLGFIAHELRNPLAAATVALQRLRNRELAAGGRTVDLIERSLRRAADMIDNALSHASLKLGADLKPEPIVLCDLLRDVELDASVDAQARGIDLYVEPARDVLISADPRLLRSAVINLVQNALKFSPAGSAVTVSARAAQDGVTIEVADACGGLPPGKIDDLFSPLVQRGENRSGFGLGLTIARQAVEAHGGRINVRDVPGAGCVFRIELPRPPPQPARNP